MFISTHATASAAIASLLPNPLISLPLVFAGHFVLDKIPHWPDDTAKKRLSKNVYTLVVVDVIVALALIIWLVKTTSNTIIVWAALAGSIMDIDAVFYHGKFKAIFKTPLPKQLSKIHGRIQKETSSTWGIIVQFTIILLSLYLVVNYA